MQNALGHTGATTFTFASRNTWNVQYMAEQPVGCKTNGTMTFTFASCSTWTAEPPSTVRGATCGMMELFLDWTFPWLNNSLTELFLDWTFDLFHEWTFSLVLKLHNSELYSELLWLLCGYVRFKSHQAIGQEQTDTCFNLTMESLLSTPGPGWCTYSENSQSFVGNILCCESTHAFAFGIGPLSWPLLCWTMLSKSWAGCWRNAHTFATEFMPSRLSTETGWCHSRMG